MPLGLAAVRAALHRTPAARRRARLRTSDEARREARAAPRGRGTRVTQQYEAVIGIECHVELKTATQDVLRLPQRVRRRAEHESVSGVSWACPARLPVPNAKAIEHMIRAGLAFGAEIPAFSKFDRKNYFYPDMPKDYQISQYDMPLTQGGSRDVLARGRRQCKSCRLTRIHLEEDTGKSTHAGSGDGRIAGSDLFAGRLQPRGRAADGMRLGARDSRRGRSRRLSRSAQVDAASTRRQRRQDGRRLAALRCQRLGASGGRTRTRHEDRDQEHELVSFGAARDRKRDRASDRACSKRAGASCRRRAAGTRCAA